MILIFRLNSYEEQGDRIMFKTIALVALFSLITPVITAEATTPPPFPTISINAPEEVWQDRETWFAGEVAITSHEQSHNFAYTSADIRGRGNSTWNSGQGPDKRPLRFRFPAGEARGILQFNDYTARTWILLSNHFDKSLMRNFTAQTFSDMLDGMYWTPVSQFVHLYVNGEYMGVYLLTDERDIYPMTTGRMQITPHSDPTISEFVIERDRRANRNNEITYRDYVRVYGVVYDIRFPNGNANRSIEAGQYVYNFLAEVSRAIRSGDFERMQAIVDIDAFVDFFIVQELMRNPDVGFSSVFMQIMNQPDGGRRLVMGPTWDFDIAAGNNRGARPDRIQAATRNYWFGYALRNPQFAEVFVARWHEVAPLVDELLATVHELAEVNRVDFERNFYRHPIMGVDVWRSHPATLELTTHMEHVQHLISFLETRYEYLTGYFDRGVFNFSIADRDFNSHLENSEVSDTE